MAEQLALPVDLGGPTPGARPATTAPIGGRPRVDGAVTRYVLELARRRMSHAYPGVDAELVFETLNEPEPSVEAWLAVYGALDELVAAGELRELAIGEVYVTTEAASG